MAIDGGNSATSAVAYCKMELSRDVSDKIYVSVSFSVW